MIMFVNVVAINIDIDFNVPLLSLRMYEETNANIIFKSL